MKQFAETTAVHLGFGDEKDNGNKGEKGQQRSADKRDHLPPDPGNEGGAGKGLRQREGAGQNPGNAF